VFDRIAIAELGQRTGLFARRVCGAHETRMPRPRRRPHNEHRFSYTRCMRTRRIALGVAALACATAAGACLIDIPDVSDGAAGDGGVRDTGPVCDACGAAPGFSPVFFALDRATQCPPGTSGTDVVADPGDAGPGACTCSCGIASPPSCFPASLPTAYDPTCSTTGSVLQIPAAGCLVSSGALGGTHASVAPFVPDGGTCTDVPSSDPSKVATVPARRCTPTACDATICSPVNGFQGCFEAPGDVTCPNGLVKHLVGSSVDLTCGCTACSIEVDGGCEGTITLYSGADCGSPIEAPIVVDDTCQANSAAQGTTYASLTYTPSLVGVRCVAGAGEAANVSLLQESTICCAP
jgi:hypothetical protein